MSQDHTNGTSPAAERPPSDLNGAFGSSAAASLRGLLPPRPVPEQPEQGVPEQGVPEQGVPEPRAPEPPDRPAGPPASARRSPAASARRSPEASPGASPGVGAPAVAAPAPTASPAPPSGASRRPSPATRRHREVATTTNRRWGVARMTSREHVELLVLVALRGGAADGREVVERLRDASGGRLQAPANTVYRTLHRLARGRLVERRATAGRRSYALTDSGSRAARSRVREWQALSQATEAVVRSNLTT